MACGWCDNPDPSASGTHRREACACSCPRCEWRADNRIQVDEGPVGIDVLSTLRDNAPRDDAKVVMSPLVIRPSLPLHCVRSSWTRRRHPPPRRGQVTLTMDGIRPTTERKALAEVHGDTKRGWGGQCSWTQARSARLESRGSTKGTRSSDHLLL